MLCPSISVYVPLLCFGELVNGCYNALRLTSASPLNVTRGGTSRGSGRGGGGGGGAPRRG